MLVNKLPAAILSIKGQALRREPCGSSGNLSGADGLWVSEKDDYDYNSNSCNAGKVCGHYTHVVWRNSVRIGCAKVRCNNGGTFIGCNYASPGDVVGQKPY